MVVRIGRSFISVKQVEGIAEERLNSDGRYINFGDIDIDSQTSLNQMDKRFENYQ